MRNVVFLVTLLLAVPALAAPSSQQQDEKKPPQQPVLQDVSPQQPPAPPQPSPEELEALRQIEEASRTDLRQVPALVEQFLAQFPESLLRTRVYTAGSAAHRTLGNLEKSIQYATKGLELVPDDVVLLIQRADALAESAVPGQADFLSNLTRAEEEVRRAQQLLPDFFAQTIRRPDVPPEQYDLQQRYLESLPHSILGSISLKRNEFRQAAEEFQRATELNVSSADDFLRLGVSRMMLREWEAAKAALERSVELSPPGSPVAQYAQRRLEMVERNLQAAPAEIKPQEE